MPDSRSCAHCGGTGTCMSAVPQATASTTSAFSKTYHGHFVCSVCGKGIHGDITVDGRPTGGVNSASRPVCRVCGGSGYVKI